MKWAGTFIAGLFFMLGLAVTSTQAAYLYLDPDDNEIYPGDTLTVPLRIDTDEGECINAVDIVLTYDPGIEPVDISRGSSIFPIWIEEPTIDTAKRQITMAGGIPNGYCGRISGDPRLTNRVADLVFQAPGFSIGASNNGSPTSTIGFSNNTSVYLNDGVGTRVAPQFSGAAFFVHKKPRADIKDQWNQQVAADETPPQEFSINLEKEEAAFSNRYYITFNTTDKQTGIDHYEVMEEPISQRNLFSWGEVNAPWLTTRSPYVLKDQSLNSTILVKAVDKAGNEYIARLVPEGAATTNRQHQIIYISLAVIGLLLLMLVGFWYYRKRKLKTADDNFYSKVESYED